MKLFVWTAITFAGLMCLSLDCVSQTSAKPRIIRSIKSESKPDRRLEKILRSEYVEPGDNADIRYYYNQVDLDGDNRKELIVFVFGEHQCGTSGCRALIYRKRGRSYKLLTEFGPARNPIIVSTTRTNGWRDLLFWNSGGGVLPAYYSISRFNGKSYPDNPTVPSKSPPIKRRYRGIAYLIGPYDPSAGLRLPSH